MGELRAISCRETDRPIYRPLAENHRSCRQADQGLVAAPANFPPHPMATPPAKGRLAKDHRAKGHPAKGRPVRSHLPEGRSHRWPATIHRKDLPLRVHRDIDRRDRDRRDIGLPVIVHRDTCRFTESAFGTTPSDGVGVGMDTAPIGGPGGPWEMYQAGA